MDTAPTTFPRGKVGMKVNKMNICVSLFTGVYKCSVGEWTSSLYGWNWFTKVETAGNDLSIIDDTFRRKYM